MIARLQRFYGGDPLAWLRMPLVVLRSYVDNITPLRSGENLDATTVAALGSGHVKQSDIDRQVARWQHAAYGVSRVVKPASEEERVLLIQAAGIGV